MMSRAKRALWVGCVVWLTASAGLLASLQQPPAGPDRNAFDILIDGWGPYTLEEELKIAHFLYTITSNFVKIVESLEPEKFAEDPQYDEETAEKLAMMISDLQISLKEMVATLDLIKRIGQQGPGDYAQSAPALWLTVIKDISLEKDNARQLERLGLFSTNWMNLAETALPRLFSRILEPKLAQLLRDQE